MHTNLWFWIAFNAGVLCVLAIDLFGFQRKAHAPSTKEAAIWTAVWVALSLGFNALIWLWEGHAKALEFLTGYLVEYSLSADNIFVFVPAIILSFIGTKMILADVYHISTAASLGVVGSVLLAAISLSLLVNRRRPATAVPATETDHYSPPVTNLR